ncbi:hypothetical protein D3C87_1530580 [compost metagenome]
MRTQRGLPWGDGQRHVKIASFRPVARVRLEAHFQVQVAVFAAAIAGHALPCQTDELAFAHAWRNTHAERAGLHLGMALVVHFHGPQADVARRALERVFQVHLDGGVVVVAARAEILLARAAPLAAAAEQRRKELAELRLVAGRRATVEFKAFVPPGRRLEPAIRRHAGRKVVIGLALFLVAQHVIGFVDVAHAGLGVAFLADVGMVFAGKFPVRAPDLVFGGAVLHA